MTGKMAGVAALMIVALGMPADALPLSRAQEAKIKPSGKPAKCITIRAIRSSRVRNDRTIDFYMNGTQVYRNRLPRRCPGLGAAERFIFTTDMPQLCYVDPITVLRGSPGIKGATCSLGKFQPVTGAPK